MQPPALDASPAMKVTKRKFGLIADLYKNKALYFMGLPGIAFFIIFSYLPMFGIVIAFEDYNVVDGLWGSQFIGFKNFEFLIKSHDIFRITFNTLFLNLLFIAFGTAFQIAIALILNEVRSVIFKKLSQSIILLPYFISWVVVGVFAYYIFATDHGILNTIRAAFGLDKMDWYANPSVWPIILTVTYIWKWTGYGSIIFMAAIVSIDPQIYESATIDGCNKWQQIKFITLPLIMPTIIILTLLAIGRIFYGDFGMIYNLVRNNVMIFSTTDVIDTYVYRAFQGTGGGVGSFPMASAAGVFQSVMGFITILAANTVVRKVNKDYALY